MLFLLPEELIEMVYRSYFSRHVLDNIGKECSYKIKLKSGPIIGCRQIPIDSAYCMRCHVLYNNKN
jgi:hypothetical protein